MQEESSAPAPRACPRHFRGAVQSEAIQKSVQGCGGSALYRVQNIECVLALVRRDMPPRPPQQPDPEGPVSMVLPSMLAPSPSQHLDEVDGPRPTSSQCAKAVLSSDHLRKRSRPHAG
jgi:hypothetical protein